MKETWQSTIWSVALLLEVAVSQERGALLQRAQMSHFQPHPPWCSLGRKETLVGCRHFSLSIWKNAKAFLH